MKELDARGLKCPLPLLRASKLALELAPGEALTVYATDPGSPADFAGWARTDPRIELVESAERDEGGKKLFVHVVKRK